jgi:glucose/arabinose dehydrogenase
VIAAALVALAMTGSRSESAQLRLVPVARGLVEPVYVTATASQPGRLYVVERRGRVRVVQGGRVRSTFLDIRRLVESGYVEQGLLSMAFHPAYPRTPRIYVDYTDRGGDTRVVEYRVRNGRVLTGTARLLLFVHQPYANHNGGGLQFGPDGKLYVGMGDGGAGGDPNNNGQNPRSRLAKLLRTRPLSVRWEIAGYGLRNPWRFSFDRKTGDLYIGDVGQSSLEEVDFRRRGARPANYGWARYEGSRPFKSVALRPPSPLVFPIAEYGRDDGCSIVGGYVYRGTAVPEAAGRYFYGDSCTGRVWSFVQRGGKATDLRREPFTIESGAGYSLVSFGEDARGELYLVSFDGVLYRLAG